MTARSLPSSDARQPPALGGLNPTVLGLEIRRLLRNRRTMIFALIAPSLFFLLFGLNKAYAHQSAGHSNVSAFILVSMALYGAVLATTAGGAILMLLSFAGGLFIPLSQYPHVLQTLAKFTPLYGLKQLVHAPLIGGSVDVVWAVNAVAWLVIFASGAVWRFRKDTARV